MPLPIEILRVDHIGIRVADAARSEEFYSKLGFTRSATGEGGRVVILHNENGVEINLIVNADKAFDAKNVLMDEPVKRAGYTHVALRVGSIEATKARLAEHGIALSGEPERLGRGVSMFVRDPDRNVVELREVS